MRGQLISSEMVALSISTCGGSLGLETIEQSVAS